MSLEENLEENKEKVRRHAEAWNNNDAAIAIDELFAADIYSHSGDMDGSAGERGREHWKEFLAEQARKYPDRHYTLLGMIAEGDKVAAMLRYNYTDPESGEKRVIFGTNIYGFRNGQISDFWGFWRPERAA